MIASEFWGVKARKSQRYRDFAENGFRDVRRCFVRKQTVRISLRVLNSPRINCSRGKTVKLKLVLVDSLPFKRIEKSTRLSFL